MEFMIVSKGVGVKTLHAIKMNKDDLEQAQENTMDALNEAQKVDLPKKVTEQVVLGFDGYKDNIVSVVKFRRSSTDL